MFFLLVPPISYILYLAGVYKMSCTNNMQSRHIFIYTFLQLHQDWLWAAPSLTFNVHQGLFPKGTMGRV